MTRGLARELCPRDITVKLMQPGSTDTEMGSADGPSADFQRGLNPLGRFGTAEHGAAAGAFLASPSARDMTGAIVIVDGGQLI
nr:SDR family oxidoreductase [Aureimonas sp. AU4]